MPPAFCMWSTLTPSILYISLSVTTRNSGCCHSPGVPRCQFPHGVGEGGSASCSDCPQGCANAGIGPRAPETHNRPLAWGLGFARDSSNPSRCFPQAQDQMWGGGACYLLWPLSPGEAFSPHSLAGVRYGWLLSSSHPWLSQRQGACGR